MATAPTNNLTHAEVDDGEGWEEEEVLAWGHALTTADVLNHVLEMGFTAVDVGSPFRGMLRRSEREVYDDWKRQEVRTFVSPSTTHVFGLFVEESVPKKNVIVEYTGVRFPVACRELVCEFYKSKGVEGDYFIE